MKSLFADLRVPGWIVTKGLLFFVAALLAFTLLLLDHPGRRDAFLLMVLLWSACRFYYFVFYAMERYVDSFLRYAGVSAMVGYYLRNYLAPGTRPKDM